MKLYWLSVTTAAIKRDNDLTYSLVFELMLDKIPGRCYLETIVEVSEA